MGYAMKLSYYITDERLIFFMQEAGIDSGDDKADDNDTSGQGPVCGRWCDSNVVKAAGISCKQSAA